ncbi:aspartyl protease family protein [Oscillatoria amoena NRMC-F 0135]|nr:aspartyl protease family protein [Oscillatoria amoena NRMC-F 0135]
MRSILNGLVLALSFVLADRSGYGQNLGFSIADGKQRVDIPIEVVNNLIVVPVILNEALPLKFIVDTGVRTAILTQKSFSDILQLQYSRKYSISGAGGEKLIDAYVTNNVSLRLPGVEGKGHALLVLEEDYLELRNFMGTDVHGILGYELFSRFIVKIDYQKKIMTLMTGEKFRPGKKYSVIPIRIQDTKPYLLAPISIDEAHSLNAKLLVDTGASHGLMLEPESDERIFLPEKTVSGIIGRGLGGPIAGKIGRIESIELGGHTLKKVLANFPDSNSYFADTLYSIERVDRNGTLGGEILSRFVVVINFPKEKIYLKPNSEFNKAFYFNLSGINVRAKGSSLNAFEVAEVRPSSVGERAGVLPGDNIVAINNIRVIELKLGQINALFNSKPGRKLKLEVERKGIRRIIEFALESQI